MIPPGGSGEFVAWMEQVLDVYKRPYDAHATRSFAWMNRRANSSGRRGPRYQPVPAALRAMTTNMNVVASVACSWPWNLSAVGARSG